MRPSTYTSEPFFRYCWAISACLPQTVILCHSVRFWRSPFLSLYVSSVASEKLATAWPPPVKRVSGSRPRRPTRITLLTDIVFLPVGEDFPEAQYSRCAAVRREIPQRGMGQRRRGLNVKKKPAPRHSFTETKPQGRTTLASVAASSQWGAGVRGGAAVAPISLSFAWARRVSSEPGKRRVTSRRSLVPVAFMPSSSSAKPFLRSAAASL